MPSIYHSRALAFNAKSDPERAAVEARKAIKLAPRYMDAHHTLGKLAMDLGRFEEAEKHLLIAANEPLYREGYKARTALGVLAYRRGMYARASEHLRKAVETEPQTACVAYYYQGHIALKNAAFKDAVQKYTEASRRYCSGFADAHLALGIAYERDKQYDRARKKFLDIRKAFPETKAADQAMERLRFIP
jgi:tetratricopeptide (TPR) repeat protein